jgi:hypothetical protein
MSQMRSLPAWRVAILLALLVAGCQADEQGAARAVESYLQARVASDVDRMTQLACPAWESQARVEAISFQAMNASLHGVVCSVDGRDGDYTRVTCSGKITTTYQGEAREWSVADQAYRTVLDGGEWRMCGYAD